MTLQKRGFTVIELLVVMAIIALLVSLILVQLGTVRAKGRDAKRESDIKTIQNALGLYVISNRLYPLPQPSDPPDRPLPLTGSDSISTALKNVEAISQIPLDPLNTGTFRYGYDSLDGTTYTLTYYLETSSIPGKAQGKQTVGQ